MAEQQQQQPQRPRLYRLEGVRPDGSRTIVRGQLPFEEAKRSQESIREEGKFADIQIIPESPE